MEGAREITGSDGQRQEVRQRVGGNEGEYGSKGFGRQWEVVQDE